MRAHGQLALLLTAAIMLTNCGRGRMENEVKTFIREHIAKIAELEKQMNLAYWEAATTGKQESYDRYRDLQLQYRTVYANREEFQRVKRWYESGKLQGEWLRQVTLLYNRYLANQIDSTLLQKIVAKSTEVEQRFNTFRAWFEGRRVSNNEIHEILRSELRTPRRKQAWEASKQVGQEVAQDLLALVRLRNEAARSLGFENYYVMAMRLAEQDPDHILRIFDQLAELTDAAFSQLKREIDAVLARTYGIDPTELRPWHYHDPFFQEVPRVFEVDLDELYADHDVKEIARLFFASIGLEVDDILARSDLYERNGKDQHAFCTDIDRAGDVRVLANLRNDEYWMNTILHELGHAVYDKYIDRALPFLLREPAHTFTTEAVAMLFGRLSRNPSWLARMLSLDEATIRSIAPALDKSLRAQQLIFARWCQVMVRFERELYKDPDQDLNTLWWDLVEHYQLVRRPEKRNQPDWAAKIHFTSAPVYYHNYMLGELLASQLHYALLRRGLGRTEDRGFAYAGEPRVGEFLRREVFSLSARYPWDEMIRRATGEELTPKYFVEQFVK
ncbi:MAG: M2 family metallopeptidase [candidate division KSB1 bacterium]|nr:M2 family metallopeptidase [candidate division KSB1 bacterium]